METAVPFRDEDLAEEVRPVVHSAAAPEDASFALAAQPPAGPFEAAGFQVLACHWENQPNRTSRFPCAWPDFNNDRLQAFRQRYDFLSLMDGASSEFERLLLLRHWVHRALQTERATERIDRWTPDPLAVLDLSGSGARFQCTQYAKVLQACAVASGWCARHVGIGSFNVPDELAYHHGVVDVFVNELAKWVALDAHYDLHYEKAGVPLSPYEIGEGYFRTKGAGVDICRGPGATRQEKNVLGTVAGAHESSRYYWNLHRWSFCDPFNLPSTRIPQQLMLVLVGERHQGQVWHQGDAKDVSTRHLHCGYTHGYFQFTRREADVYPDLGTCRVELERSEKVKAVKVKVGTYTPNFDALLVKLDERPLRPVGFDVDWHVHAGEYLPELVFDWYLREGENRLGVCTRNKFGVLGRCSTVRAVLKSREEAGKQG